MDENYLDPVESNQFFVKKLYKALINREFADDPLRENLFGG